MGTVTVQAKTTDFDLIIELHGPNDRGTKAIIFVKSPDNDAPHRVMTTIRPGTDIDQLALDLKAKMQDLPRHQEQPVEPFKWSRKTTLAAVRLFILANSDRILSP